MVNFIVVEDNHEDVKHIKALLHEIVGKDMIFKCFDRLNVELKKEIKNIDVRKVYILDIELGNRVSGINIAKLIREYDYESEIIFITNHNKMFDIVYRSVYEVFDFIEKFHDFDKTFKKDIKDILKRNFDNKMFMYNINGIDFSVYYKAILYIYRDTEDRKLVIVTDNNKYTISMCIKEIKALLDKRFKQTYRSCIANMNRVQEKNYKEGYFRLDTGEKVYMLSKKFKKELADE